MEECYKGGWVKCIKSGSYNGIAYKESEYYQLTRDRTKYGLNVHVYVDVNMKEIMMAISDNVSYGIECEWVGMEKPTDYPIF